MVRSPGADGLKVTEQLATPGFTLVRRKHVLRGSPVLKPTLPVGVVGPLEAVSVTVAMHVVRWPTDTVPGEQLTVVEVAIGSLSTTWCARAQGRTSSRPPAYAVQDRERPHGERGAAFPGSTVTGSAPHPPLSEEALLASPLYVAVHCQVPAAVGVGPPVVL